MVAKMLCVLVVALVCLQQAKSVPISKTLTSMTDTDLMNKFAQFLHEDKEMAKYLETYKLEAEHSLTKRQAEDMDGLTTDMPQKNDGFMDRAAKFVLELVQRFLKWINE